MDLKNTKAANNTITYNKAEIEAPVGNIYEAINIISKRATQIGVEIKKELVGKLDEFATYNDSLEEVFENKEQIEVSKFYERLPKPQALAVEEWLEGKITYAEDNNSFDELSERKTYRVACYGRNCCLQDCLSSKVVGQSRSRSPSAHDTRRGR